MNAELEKLRPSGDGRVAGGDFVELNDKKQQSRFRVAKVDFAFRDGQKQTTSDDDDDDEEEEEVRRGSARGQSPPNNDGHSTYEDTRNKSFRHYTREALPRADNYRNVMSVHGHHTRPTLEELHNMSMAHERKMTLLRKGSMDILSGKPATKFGWIQGVFVRCLLNIWGVMLFLRLSWCVGQTGIGLAFLVILLASAVTMLTTLSMSAICTNGEVKGGGTYYMISRSLGPEFGGSIGIIFSLANAVAVAMYVVGFTETVVDLMKLKDSIIVDGSLNDVRIIGCVTVCALLCIAIIGTEWESKAQICLLVILLTAMVNFVVGSFISPNEEQMSQGFFGYSAELARENFVPSYRDGNTFFSVFAIFFPAATGILAGANISGDLSDPQKAIPKGTFIAIVVTTITYLFFAVVAGCTVSRDANGIVEYVANETLYLISNCTLAPSGECKYGLMNNYQVMEMVSAWGPLIYAGIFAATLSSALASLVSAPKVFQALCKDRLFPHIHVFAKGYGKNFEPRRGYVLTFVIALACTAIGDLNAIAPIISNFFLAAYCLINFSCFHASFASSPGFRPAFRYYNLWLSLLGSILCLSVMFIMNWWTALITFALVLALYTFIYYRKPDVNWGSSTQAQTYKTALSSTLKLNQVQEHVKNYRPQILVLTGNPSSRPPLVDFTYCITKKLGLMVCGHYVKAPQHFHVRDVRKKNAYAWLQKRKVKAFYCLIAEESFSRGVSSMQQMIGLGKLSPNMLLMGYKANWQDCDPLEVEEYFKVIHNTFDMHLSLGILRLQEGQDYTQYVDLEEVITNDSRNTNEATEGFPRNLSTAQLSNAGSSRGSSPPSTPNRERKEDEENEDQSNHNDLLEVKVKNSKNSASKVQTSSTQVIKGLSKDLPKDVLSSVNQFQRKQKKGTIDVWWLYDDGGLTLLVPYLLSGRSQWGSCKLRVFSLANKKDELDREQRNMAALLSKFRIDYSDVIVVPDITKPPQESSKREFEALIAKWRSTNEESEVGICESEVLALKDKTNRHLRLRELLLQHSNNASLVVMTLPMPRKETCSAPMYMAWLETLTKDMTPFLLIRGNQTSVLTFYS